MPTYTCYCAPGRLDDAHRRRLAETVTRVHHDATGAPAFFVQMIFVDVAPGHCFIGGAPLDGDQVFLQGQIRAGRTAQQKQALITGLAAAVAEVSGVAPSAVWVYLVELPPSCMVEFGRILPEPGAEKTWTEGFSPAERLRLEALGR